MPYDTAHTARHPEEAGDAGRLEGGAAPHRRGDPVPDAVDVHVGARIRLLRKQRGMSQEALADKLDISFQQVQKYERGTNRISASRMFVTCAVLACRPDDLFEGLDLSAAAVETLTQALARQALTSAEAISLLAAYQACAADDQLILLALARRMGAGR